MTETIELLGKLIEGNPGRDAIHIAVAPVRSNDQRYLPPGHPLIFNSAGNDLVVGAYSRDIPIGIIDPFLKEPVKFGQSFWMFLFPSTITGLRHVWTHPAFGEEPTIGKKLEAQARIDNFANNLGLSYGEFMSVAENPWDPNFLGFEVETGHGTILSDLWDDIELVLGKKLKIKPTTYRCAC